MCGEFARMPALAGNRPRNLITPIQLYVRVILVAWKVRSVFSNHVSVKFFVRLLKYGWPDLYPDSFLKSHVSDVFGYFLQRWLSLTWIDGFGNPFCSLRLHGKCGIVGKIHVEPATPR